ncbi:MAG TPA: MG2 domain-containing protein, partial [Myxococcota bacterium]|nr:MG2 domain-containing protein [Myxococcota bacterium]
GLYLLGLGAGKLEATTALLVTDLAVVAKAGYRELFVFTQDLRTLAPAPGARVLVSDGAKIVGEGETDAQGALRVKLPEEADGSQLQVFASRGEHLAWLGGATPLTNPPEVLNRRALVLSDRPVYRPGERVHLSGVFRDARDGLYATAAGETLELWVRDARGRSLLEEKVRLDEFGVFERALVLEPDAPPGAYSVSLNHIKGDSFSARFEVQAHRRLPYDLEVRLDHPVVHRGEPAQGSFTVRHAHGTPAPDVEVQYWYDGGPRVETGRTDTQGRLPFSFATREFEENRTLVLHFRLLGAFQQAEARVLVAASDLRLRLEAGREGLFAGQPFELLVHAEGPQGDPRAATARLEVLEQVPPSQGERRVFDQQVTVPAEGLARVPVRLAHPGSYVVRLSARDGAGEPVVSELALHARGADEPRLSLEIDRPVQTLGRPAKLSLRSTLPARALVLVTVETERVLEHRALVVAPGETALEVPVRDALVPAFQVAAVALEGDRLHHTTRSLEVSRELQVEIRADREEVAPGEEVQLTLTARDQDGRPADAEFLLSVVDEALLEAFPDLTPSLDSVFARSRDLEELAPRASNLNRFPAVEAAEVERAEVDETQGSAAMAALSSRRRAMTEKAIGEFDSLAARESMGVGGLGSVGYGSGGGGAGFGRVGGRVSKVMMGKAGVMGGKDARWRRAFEEGALFRADVRTGPDGVAGLAVRMPDGISRWRVTARGVTRDTLVGEARKELRTAKAFWARLDLPPELESGDRVLPVARVFNDTAEARKARLSLTAGGKAQAAELDVPAHGVAAHAFPELAAGEAGQSLVLALEAQAGALTDRLELAVPVRARGVRLEVGSQGLLTGREQRSLHLAEGLREPRLGVRLGTRLASFFLGDCQGCSPSAALGGRGPHAALVDLAILELLGPEADATLLAGVRTRLRAELAWLLSARNSEGGWGWSEDGATSLEVTAAAVEALARARVRAEELGWRQPQAELDAAAQLLQASLASLPPEDFLRRAEILHALAQLGEAQVPAVQLHRLHRLRRDLGLGAQALLGLAWLALGRPEQAAEVAAVIGDPLAETPPGTPWERWAPSGWVSDLDRTRALLLLSQVNPADPRVARALTWLHAGGRVLGWSSPRLAAVALRAIARLESARSQGARLRVTLRLNGQPAGQAELIGPAGLAELELDPRLIRPGANELELIAEGNGAAWWSARLSGHSQDGSPTAKSPVTLRRRVEPVPLPYRGQPIEAGFSTIAPTGERWVNDVPRMPAGGEVDVTLELERQFDAPLDHCVLEERIPPGFALQPGVERGDFTHLRAEGRRLYFHLGPAGRRAQLRYRLTAVEPGAYAFPPLRLVSLAHPEVQALGPGTTFTVDPAGAARPEVKPTPDELHDRGMTAARLEDSAQALRDLEALWSGYELRAEYVPAVLEQLLFSAIALEDPERILKYFELTKERNPDLVVPFEKIGPVQDAYRKLKAHEGGLHLDRGLAEALFLRQIRTVGALEAEGEVAEAMALLREILGAFPDLHVAARAAYAFSQVLYGRADKVAEGEPVEGFDRPGLLQEVERFMAGFLALFPEDPEAPPAVFSLASALLEADRPEPAAEWCAVGLERHAKSDLAPAIAYLKAFAHFRLGQYGESLELCRRVAEEATQEEHRGMARYIMAQIYHARGELARARELYEAVRETFRDARETLDELARQSLAVPDVVVVPPGETPRLPVSATNVKEVALRAYRVDLMKLYLVKRSLRDLAQVNLAGVKPIMNRGVRLQSQGRSGPVEERLPLDVPGKGAYLVLARAGSQTVPSLVLVGGLTLEVTELAEEGRVRVTVRDARGTPLPGSRIQLKGEQNDRFQAGQADLRGVFLASGIQGPVTAIALKDGAYGLYRGTQDIQGSEGPDEGKSGQRNMIDFGDDNVQGELYKGMLEQQAMPAAKANEFFKQDVKGMSAQQAK